MTWQDAYQHYRDGFAEALDERLYTIEYLDALVHSGEGILFATDKAAIIVEIKEFPTGARAVHGLVATGKLESIKEDLIPQAEALGREIGCAFGMIASTRAWGRIMKERGYAPHQMTLIKDL